MTPEELRIENARLRKENERLWSLLERWKHEYGCVPGREQRRRHFARQYEASVKYYSEARVKKSRR